MVYCTQCGQVLQDRSFLCCHCGTRCETTYESKPADSSDESELIQNYFKRNFSYDHIIVFLRIHHSIYMSKRTLKRRLQQLGLKRRSYNISDNVLRSMIENELEGPAVLKGYRGMWNHLRCKYGVVVKRDTVMHLLREIDPDGTELRRARRLKRRVYTSPGPNHCWHIDGYDKLKPYGLPIHGCIDGFSRKILWLKVVKSNNNPIIPAFYFLRKVKDLCFCPQKLRTDCGTENGIMADIQCSLVGNEDAHLYGSSVANQRIENWWSHNKKAFTTWVIDFFKQMVEEGILIPGHHVHMECVWFVFSHFLQLQLDEVVYEWNTHYIRQTNHETIPGVPDILYHAPILSGHEDKKVAITQGQVQRILQEKNVFSEATEIFEDHDQLLKEYFEYVIQTKQLRYPPKNWEEARSVYKIIIEKC